MRLPHYEKHWRGVDFASLKIPLLKDKPVGEDFYAVFYERLLASGLNLDQEWIDQKIKGGQWVFDHILTPYRKEIGRDPKILSLGVGEGYFESVWLEQNLDVTLNECQETSLINLRKRHPSAKFLVGSVNELELMECYDTVVMVTLDSLLSDTQLRCIFEKCRKALSPGGLLINITVDTLSLRRLLSWAIKYVLREYDRPGYVNRSII